MIGGREKSTIERGACNVVSGRDEKSEKERERRRASRVAGSSSGSELRPKRSASVPFSSFFSYLQTCRRGRRFVERFVRRSIGSPRLSVSPRSPLLIPLSFSIFLCLPLFRALSVLVLARIVLLHLSYLQFFGFFLFLVLPLVFSARATCNGERGALTLRMVVVPGAWCWCW